MSRVLSFPAVGALAFWQDEVCARIGGQDPADEETWHEDALFVAARYEVEAEEWAAVATRMRQTRPTTWWDGSPRSERSSWQACATRADQRALECRWLSAEVLIEALAEAREAARGA